jgi:hypothetical protein
MEAGNVSVIDEYQAVQLLEDVAIAPFMLSNECKMHSDSKIGKCKTHLLSSCKEILIIIIIIIIINNISI